MLAGSAKLYVMANGKSLTLMAVHAHPDDEAVGTGGVLARYSAEGVRTVLVTCTNGEQGDGLGGAKPGEQGHDPGQVAATRLAELRKAAGILEVGALELLGYRDSGMAGWAANADPEAFCNVPVERVAEQLAALMGRYRPQVVVTYDPNGGYGHPDHVQAHRATVAASAMSGIPDKLYYVAFPRSWFAEMRNRLDAAGVGNGGDGVPDDFGTPDEDVTAQVDVSGYVRQKLSALEAHASQSENFAFNTLPEELLLESLSREWFTLRSAPAAGQREDDLFAGLR